MMTSASAAAERARAQRVPNSSACFSVREIVLFHTVTGLMMTPYLDAAERFAAIPQPIEPSPITKTAFDIAEIFGVIAGQTRSYADNWLGISRDAHQKASLRVGLGQNQAALESCEKCVIQ